MENKEPGRETYDVIIVGGGLAGLALGRQLHLELPRLNCIILDSSTEFKRKVGEATVEIQGHYLLNRLQLSKNIFQRQLPKNGLRFFFDNEQRSLDLMQMSEIGTTAFPPHPAFQLDRAYLENDLYEMNLQDGVEVLRGVRVTKVDLGQGDDRHRVSFTDLRGQSREIAGRWVVDASGRKGVLDRELGLHHEEDTLDHVSCWGRFRNINDLDRMGDKAWRAKVGNIPRHLSTNHFPGEGYWIWVIPLSSELTSIGVVASKEIAANPPLKKQEFLDFLRGHHGLSQIMGQAELVDFLALPKLAYRTSRVFSADRWATTGFAALFLDPLYSYGGDYIAHCNDYIVEMIRLETDPMVDRAEFEEAVEIYNRAILTTYDYHHTKMDSCYRTVGSYNLFRIRVLYDFSTYILHEAWNFVTEDHLDRKYLKSRPLFDYYMKLEEILNEQTRLAVPRCLENGSYYGANEGMFESGAGFYRPFILRLGEKGIRSWRMDLMIKAWTYTYNMTTGFMLDLPRFAQKSVVQNLMHLPNILERHPFDEKDLDWLCGALAEQIAGMIKGEFEVDLRLGVDRESFHTGMVAIENPEDLPADRADEIAMRIKAIWMEEREYYENGSFVNALFGIFRSRERAAVAV